MITDEQIKAELDSLADPTFRFHMPEINRNQTMYRLVRCWCDNLPGHLHSGVEQYVLDGLIEDGHALEDFDPKSTDSFWFGRFGSPVIIRAMRQIYELEAEYGFDAPTAVERTAIQRLRQQQEIDLQQFGSAATALEKLREAAELLGLPRDFYTCRELGAGNHYLDVVNWRNSPENSSPKFTRLPDIEAYPAPDGEACMHTPILQEVAYAAYVSNYYESNLQFAPKAGRQAFEQWAIRKLWAGITEAFESAGGTKVIKNQWVTVSKLLRLCNVDVESAVVSDAIKPRSKATLKLV